MHGPQPGTGETAGARLVYALKAGCAAARGEIIACTDADTVVPPEWLTRLVGRLLADPGAVAVGGVFDLHDCPPHLRRLGGRISRLNWHLAGRSMAVRKRDLQAVGGSSSQINLCGDTELGMRMRQR